MQQTTGIQQIATTTQQPERLVQAARRAGIKHGTEHVVHVENVAVYPERARAPREAVLAKMRFCHSSVRIKEFLNGEPDDGDMSRDVILDGNIPVPHITASEEPRFYRLEHVILCSNGRTELRATPETRFVRTDLSDDQKDELVEQLFAQV